MAGSSARAGAWTLLTWAAATVVVRPLTRLLAEAHGFAITWLVWVDVVYVLYALVTAGVVVLHLRRRRTGRSLAWLALPPLAFEILRRGGLEQPFLLDVSGYPASLAILHWIGNLLVLALVAAFALLLLWRPEREHGSSDS